MMDAMQAPDDIVEMAARRSEARAAKDFAAADELRAQIADAGWVVVDEPDGGWQLSSAPRATAPERIRAADVPSVLDEPPDADISVHWVCEGWPEDIARATSSFRTFAGARGVQYVVADVTGADPGAFGPDVEVLPLEAGTGWGAACNAGLRRSRGRLVFLMDGSIECAGDVFSPLEAALEDPGLGIAGPFGIVTHDLRQFDEASGPGPCDAVEGYFMAMRREVAAGVGSFDEKFRWYRTADIEFSFRVKDAGLRTEVVDVPVTRHEHRMWFETDPLERAKWSKRNFYRFLDRWRDRWDLVLDPRPPER
jgi:Glycosyl transferase family 2